MPGIVSRKKMLSGNKLVATVMSNKALEIFMQDRGGELIRTPVGDKHVVQAMCEHGISLGGEQSGHLIFLEHSTTGDGILAALQMLKIMQENGRPASELAGILELFPQTLINVPVGRRVPFDEVKEVRQAVLDAENVLGAKGRVLLRYSGTEPKARVMVEGEDGGVVESMARELARTIRDFVK